MAKYIGSIDGLRAVAVLLVLFFHAGFEFARGGFIGVDIFFVISGFLITGIIVRDHENGAWSFGKFYMRRAARLLPALFATVIATCVASFFIFAPSDLERLGQSGLYAAVSASNIFFWLEAGYFDQAASTKPLLHTWSLGVEEQFYLLWPAIIILIASRFGRAAILPSICIIGALSFIGAAMLNGSNPSAVFFLTPFRMYQFALGAFVALAFSLKPGGVQDVAGYVSALAMLALGYFASGDTNNLYLNAAAPALCAAIFLWASQSRAVGLVFSSLPMRWIGERSYSIYLVHWPIMVLWPMATDYSLSPAEGAASIVVSIAAGAGLHAFIEKPLRFKSSTSAPQRLRSFTTAMAMLALSLVVCAHLWGLRGIPSRIAPELRAAVEDTKALRLERWGALSKPNCGFTKDKAKNERQMRKCLDEPLAKGGSVLLIGDSLADDFGAAFRLAYPDVHFAQLALPGCGPAFTPRRHAKAEAHCFELLEMIEKKYTGANSVDTIIFAADWRPFHIREIRDFIEPARAHTNNIVLVGPRIAFADRVPTLALRASSIAAAQTKTQHFILQNSTSKSAAIRRNFDGKVTYLDFEKLQCFDNFCPVFTDNDEVIYFDHHHLTRAGIEWVAERLAVVYPDINGAKRNRDK